MWKEYILKRKKWQHKEPERRTNETKEQNVKTILRLWILLYLNPEPLWTLKLHETKYRPFPIFSTFISSDQICVTPPIKDNHKK